MSFSPVNASKEIVDKYLVYLKTIFKIKDEEYSRLFNNEISKRDYFYKGPYLDVTSSFESGKTTRELVANGILTSSFLRFNLSHDRKLYKHQELAIEKSLKGRNLVVSTGTGSGKTESFLFPILNFLSKLNDEKALTPGVRAIIIYPMNALANDQMDRLRVILKNYPEITFGSYTGQTQKEYPKALANFHELNDYQNPLPNELISREQMHETPPHILITNYSMLEYLMLRPESSVFFEDDMAKLWKYIVLDEAHIYSGSTGIEVSMLLRRLKARLSNFDIQFFLTSATLGTEKENKEAVKFASDLCDTKFDEEDIIRAYRVKLVEPKGLTLYDKRIYSSLSKLVHESNDSGLKDALAKHLGEPVDDVENAIYRLVFNDLNYWNIKEKLTEPKTVENLSKELGWSETEVEDFVTVAGKGFLNGVKLFDSRYHMFVRATDSVYVTLPPLKRLFFERKKIHYEDGKEYMVFELASCMYCNSIYIIGKRDSGYLKQGNFVTGEDVKEVYLLNDEYTNDEEDSRIDLSVNSYLLCSRCGKLSFEDDFENGCDHGKEYKVRVTQVNNSNKDKITKCISCSNVNTNTVLRTFYSGQEAVSSVLSTALFEALPKPTHKEHLRISDQQGKKVNIFSKSKAPTIHLSNSMNNSRQFIAFSDSRQAAAYFASYLDSTYESLLYRRVVNEALVRNMENNDECVTVKSLIDFTTSIMREKLFSESSKNNVNPKSEAAKAVFNELTEVQSAFSLNSMGYMKIIIDSQQDDGEELSKQEYDDLFGFMIETLLSYGIIEGTTRYNLNDEDILFFSFTTKIGSVSLSESSSKEGRISFIPTRENMSNRRLDYITKVMEKSGIESDGIEVLEAIFNFFVEKRILKRVDGVHYRIDVDLLEVKKDTNLYQCNKCRRITNRNVKNVCPTYKCNGEISPIDKHVFFKDNHYYRLASSLDISPLRVEEHTAQLTKEKAYDLQKQFVKKEIDVLSCSTTFEMGVDVGSLETVFMRNVPPSPSNYAQRAGRAGRSKNSAAYALTLCNKSSHDFTYFNHPLEMIKGTIYPPSFNVKNDKIIVRHIYATALSEFWRNHPEYYDNASVLVEEGISKFKEFLDTKPQRLRYLLENTLSKDLHNLFMIDSYGWVDELFAEGKLIDLAISEYREVLSSLDEGLSAEQEKMAKNKNASNRSILERKRTIEKENPISFLAHGGVLPRYGFPVDTVDLKIDPTNNDNLDIEVSRDLSIAVAEFAPGSQIVANGKMITSRYIDKVQKYGWKEFAQTECKKCRSLNIRYFGSREDIPSLFDYCSFCNSPLEGAVYPCIIPSFGFVADTKEIKKAGTRKPIRTYKGEVSYVGSLRDVQYEVVKINSSNIKLAHREKDQLAILNSAKFHVCNVCGYGQVIDKRFNSIIKHQHKNSKGRDCYNRVLETYTLGYIFATDVIHLSFEYPDITNRDEALSVLHALLNGVSYTINVDRKDINGVLSYHYNEFTKRYNYDFVIYDQAAGGSGYSKQILNEDVFENVLLNSLSLVKSCTCGGELKDSSCYSCLRDYRNQRYHDSLKRSYVIDFFESLFNKDYQPVKLSFEDEWDRASRLVNEECKKILEYANDKLYALPEIGYEFETRDYAEAEIVWLDKKVACLSSNQVQYSEIIKELGFKIVDCGSDKWKGELEVYYGD